MKQDISEFLLGLGFVKLSTQRRKMLVNLLLISLGLHLAGLIVFGSWVVMRAQLDEQTVFVTPPPIKTYEPRKLEHRVKVQERQRSSSRPSMVPRMVAMKPADLSLPEIKMDPKVVSTSFQPKFKAVGGKGLGVGVGTGYGIGGFGTGVASYDFFGIRGRADRVAILVDVSVSMIEEEVGGPAGFLRVKQRINEVIDALHEAALFNVIVFADAASVWQEQLVIANSDNKAKAKRFLTPFNTEGNYGLTNGNYYSSIRSVPATGGTTRLDLALSAAFENGADTILIISDGLPMVGKGLTEEQARAHNEQRSRWYQQNEARLRAWQAAESAARVEEERVWVPPQPARPATPPREGKPAQPARPASEGRWEMRRVRAGNLGARPEPPAMPDPGNWTLSDFVEHLAILNKQLYEPKGRKPPIIHSIGYQIDREGGQFLRGLATHYKGKYRRVATLR